MPHKDPKDRKEYFRNYHKKNRERINEMSRKNYQKNRESILKRNKKRYNKNKEEFKREAKTRRKKLKLEILTHYGGNPPKCTCCGETIIEFLTIDHIHGGGLKHLKKVGFGTAFYYWIKRNNFPEGLQVLCWNCNMAKGHFGVCPHKEFMERMLS